jgi:putative alpha-1,2-mannosidase
MGEDASARWNGCVEGKASSIWNATNRAYVAACGTGVGVIHLGNGRAFVIEAFGADAEHSYVASAELNGKHLDRAL